MAEFKKLEGQPTEEQLKRIKVVEEASTNGIHAGEDMKSFAQLAYYTGYQYIAINKAQKTIVPLPKKPWEVQYTANRIMPAVRTELAKVMRNKLTKKVVPASSEEEDIRAALLADKVVQWLEYELNLQEVDEEAVLWTLVTRTGFIKCVWNPAKGMTLATEDGKAAIKQGDVDVEILSLFELKWDPSASRFKDAKWKLHERQRTVDYVKEVYGVEVEPEEDLTEQSIYHTKLSNLTADAFNTTPSRAENMVVVKEYWEEPTPDYPNGRRITIANGQELDYTEDIGYGEEDTTEREVPIFQLTHIPIPGKVIGSSIVEQLMPVQREYNKSRTQVIENGNLMANPMWLVEEGSMDDDLETRPGGIAYYKNGFNPPVMSQPKPLGSDVYQNIDICIEEFRTISGQQEVTQGTAPTGVSSGVAIQLLQEQDDTKMGPTIAKYGRFKQKYLSHLLKIIRFMYTEERTVQMMGDNKRFETLEFRGSDLTSFDVRMEDMSLTQLSNAARKQYVIELISYGVLNPQMDKDLIIRMLELGINDELYDAAEIDVQQALNENMKWSRGEFNTITRDFFNHEVHIGQHNKFRKGEEYAALSSEAIKAIDKHVEEHEAYLMQAMQEQAAAMTPQEPVEEEVPDESVNVDNVMNALTPEERAAVEQDPSILDSI